MRTSTAIGVGFLWALSMFIGGCVMDVLLDGAVDISENISMALGIWAGYIMGVNGANDAWRAAKRLKR